MNELSRNDKIIKTAEKLGWTRCRLAILGAGAPEREPSPHGQPPGRNQNNYRIGVKGELYPCKPDIFELTYEPADSPHD